MRSLLLNRHESEIGVVYRDGDKRYCVYETDGRWAMYRTKRSGTPVAFLGYALSMRDARVQLRRHRGPLGRADWLTLLAGVLVAGIITALWMSGAVSLKTLIIAMLVGCAALMLVTVILAAVIIYSLARAMRRVGFGLF